MNFKIFMSAFLGFIAGQVTLNAVNMVSDKLEEKKEKKEKKEENKKQIGFRC